MPYIIPDKRSRFDAAIWELQTKISTEGELNYVITRLVQDLNLHLQGYAYLNAIVGVLSCVLQEFYRRVAVPYEDAKRAENGDVFYSSLTGSPPASLPPEPTEKEKT